MSNDITDNITSIPTEWTLKGFVVSRGKTIHAHGNYYLNFEVSHGKDIVSCVIKSETEAKLPVLTMLKAIHLNCLAIQSFTGARNNASMIVEIIGH